MNHTHFQRVESAVMFVLLLFVPDFFMAGYAKNNHFGALYYNIGHSYILPGTLLFFSFFIAKTTLLPISIIWIAHIAMDRMLGYGLKLKTGFSDTHLGKIGRKK